MAQPAQPVIDVPAYEIVVAQAGQEIQDCFDVRIQVFHHEQKFPLETELDSMEDLATHFLLRLVPSLTPVGTIRGYKVPDTTYYKLTRLAVLKPYRRFRFGSVLVSVFHDWVQEDARIQLGQGKSSLTASTSTNRDVSHGGQHHGESAHDVLPLPSADGIISTIVSSSTQTNPTVNKIGTGSEVGERVVEIVCHSQIPVKGFYAKFGYEPVGDEFDEDGDPHQKMVLRLPY